MHKRVNEISSQQAGNDLGHSPSAVVSGLSPISLFRVKKIVKQITPLIWQEERLERLINKLEGHQGLRWSPNDQPPDDIWPRTDEGKWVWSDNQIFFWEAAKALLKEKRQEIVKVYGK